MRHTESERAKVKHASHVRETLLPKKKKKKNTKNKKQRQILAKKEGEIYKPKGLLSPSQILDWVII